MRGPLWSWQHPKGKPCFFIPEQTVASYHMDVRLLVLCLAGGKGSARIVILCAYLLLGPTGPRSLLGNHQLQRRGQRCQVLGYSFNPWSPCKPASRARPRHTGHYLEGCVRLRGVGGVMVCTVYKFGNMFGSYLPFSLNIRSSFL